MITNCLAAEPPFHGFARDEAARLYVKKNNVETYGKNNEMYHQLPRGRATFPFTIRMTSSFCTDGIPL
eukprot:CAMPEP_0197060336 /NCGR_PEP_ID=MMETSP1384-20130603/126085_1 /TAXON_ID=29189 /ORGANISM="Ammonia sp." /LENGTH=67 /DNA_ID=CAMNT_0042495653 /DNA_START=14 /DNA_END=213 /DNA_ORIENTATION=+